MSSRATADLHGGIAPITIKNLGKSPFIQHRQAMIGERLGKWVLHKEIGRGGMGRVYLAIEDVTGEKAAIKVLAAELAQDPGFLNRFQREIEALRMLQHPNIVRFIESGFENLSYFYAMEYVEGESVEDYIHRQVRIPWTDMVDVGLQIVPALRHVHDHGIIHRDIKPSNILISSLGEVKLTDFGIAKVFAATHLTATGGVVGTAEFLSPEQAGGKVVGKRSDIYCLGAVFYAMLSGRPPFQGSNYVDLIHKHRYGTPEKLSRLLPDLPYEIDELVMKMLEKDPNSRPHDCHVLFKSLDSIRKRLATKGKNTQAANRKEGTVAENFAPAELGDRGPGPATMMSRLMREEIRRQNQGGPIQQFFNRPVVLVFLLLLVVGTIAWTFWPLTERQLFERGAEMMNRDHPVDWERGWHEYLEPLNQRFPDHPYKEQIDAFRLQVESARKTVTSEAQKFYQLADAYKQQGNLAAAERTWQNLVHAFAEVESERDWVRRAEKALLEVEKHANKKERWTPVFAALNKAHQHSLQGKVEESERILRAVEELYRHDPGAVEVQQEIARIRKK